MASKDAENSGGLAALGILGILCYWLYKKIIALSALKLVLLVVGIAGCITLMVGLFRYFRRTTTEPRERTVAKPDRRYNVGYREEQETYQAIIDLPYGEILRNQRLGFRISIIGAAMALCLVLLVVLPNTASDGKQVRYITTESGMNLRESASSNGKLIRVIPFRAGVEIIESGPEEVIYGKSAHWLKVSYSGQTGWIWGYFTSSQKP